MTKVYSFNVAVKEHGRMNLPKPLRTALNLTEGDDLIFRVKPDGTAEVLPAASLARRGRGIFSHLKQERSETDTFIAERQAEADR